MARRLFFWASRQEPPEFLGATSSPAAARNLARSRACQLCEAPGGSAPLQSPIARPSPGADRLRLAPLGWLLCYSKLH